MIRARGARIVAAVVVLLALQAGVSGELLSQSAGRADTARAAAIVRRYMYALGGKEAFEEPKHTYALMTTSMSTSGGVMRMETWRQPPKLLTRHEVSGMGVTEFGFDGTTGWTTSPTLGTMLLGEIPKEMLGLGDAAWALHLHPMSYVGNRAVEGKTYEAVVFRPKGQISYTGYFDPSSGLLAGIKMEGTGDSLRMDMLFGDYKRIGSILRPTLRTTRLAGGIDVVSRIDSMSTDPIDPKVFEPPPKVRELKKKTQ